MKKLKNRLVASALTASMLVLNLSGMTPAVQVAGEESEEFIPIRTIEELYNIRNDLDGNYRLMNDIDLTEATAKGGDWDYMGNGWNPIGSNDVYGAEAFTGTFDGAGHAITGMRIEINTWPHGMEDTAYLGLFSQNAGKICNIHIESSIVQHQDTYNNIYAGGLVACNGSTLDNCFHDGDIQAISYNSVYCGGIAGSNTNGIISISHNNGDITASAKRGSNSEPEAYSGGIVGYGISGTISECYNIGTVSGVSPGNWGAMSGGIVGRWGDAKQATDCVITNCYNTGKISTVSGYDLNRSACGIAGYAEKDSHIQDCYNLGYTDFVDFDNSYSDVGRGIAVSFGVVTDCYYLAGSGNTCSGATSLTDKQMKIFSLYTGFDFDTTWRIDTHSGYPYPQLQTQPHGDMELIQNIRLLSPPDRVVYRLHETPVYEGGQIEVVYTSGKTERVDITAANTTGIDTSAPGLQTATVTFRNKTVTFDVYVTDAAMTGISVLSLPAKTTYLEGEALNLDGLVVSASFDDETTELLPHYQLTGYDPTPGTKTITVSFNGMSATFQVTVRARSLTGIELTQAPEKRTYLEGEALDLDGLILTAAYDNGDRETVSDYEVSGYDPTPGTKTVRLTYGGKTVSFKVLVEARSLSSLEIQTLPTKLVYLEGDDFDPSGMVVIAHYNNGDQEETSDYEIVGYDSTPGEKTVTLQNGEATISFTVTVTPRALTSISVTNQPRKLTYLEGETLDPTGLEITAHYNNGTSQVVSGYALAGYTSTPGKKTVIVTYQGKITTFEVTVQEKQLTELEVTQKPTKLVYLEGDAFEPAGMVVTARYNNGTSEIVTDYSCTGYDPTPGTKTIAVTYNDMITYFTVDVTARACSGIVITQKPAKLTYLEGEAFDPAGMVVTAQYNNGTSETIEEYSITGYDPQPGSKTIRVEYQGENATFTVNVKARSLESIEITKQPDKTEYIEGQELDTAGLIVTAHYDNGTSEPVTDYSTAGYTGEIGMQTIVVTYQEKTASFSVRVIARIVTGLEIQHLPNKTNYLEGDELETDGLVVVLTYNDGSTKETDDYTLTGYSSLPGLKTISVMCDGQTAQFQVTVQAKTLTHIAITYPEKLTYYVNEEFVPDGLTVTAHYDNGKAVELDEAEYMVDGFDSKTPGNKTLTVSYQGKTQVFSVSVMERPVPEASYSISSALGRAGDTVSVTVSAKRNPGIAGFRHTIHFDPTVLKFISVEGEEVLQPGNLVVNEEQAGSGQITLVWFNPTDIKADGELYTLTFEILEGAAAGASDVTLSFEEKDNQNAAGEYVFFQTSSGVVEVADYILGDLTGDKILGMKDVLLLAQVVSGQSIELTEKQRLAADVNEDDKIDLSDVILLSQWLMDAPIGNER